jgi:hypothetical protein
LASISLKAREAIEPARHEEAGLARIGAIEWTSSKR